MNFNLMLKHFAALLLAILVTCSFAEQATFFVDDVLVTSTIEVSSDLSSENELNDEKSSYLFEHHIQSSLTGLFTHNNFYITFCAKAILLEHANQRAPPQSTLYI